jgi:adenine-specific DNA-methyltransferase
LTDLFLALPLSEYEKRESAEPAQQNLALTTSEGLGNAILECTSNLNFMRALETGSMRLIVTSPPYNIGKPYESKKRISIEEYVADQREVIGECLRLLDSRGSICWQVGNHVTKQGEVIPLDVVLYPVFKHFGLKLRNRIVWRFEHGLHCNSRLSGRYETILWFTKTDDYIFHLDPIRVPVKYPNKKHFKGPRKGELSSNPRGKNPGDVWDIPNVKANHVEKTEHPCQFPVELVERLVLALTDPGDNILDPYVGVGSSVIAAIKHHRNGFGADIEPRFIELAEDRIAALQRGELKLRPMGRPIHDPT